MSPYILLNRNSNIIEFLKVIIKNNIASIINLNINQIAHGANNKLLMFHNNENLFLSKYM